VYTGTTLDKTYADTEARQIALDLALRLAEVPGQAVTASGVVASASSFYAFLRGDST
jgi:hypothetical protein